MTAPDVRLEFDGISKSFFGVQVLHDVSYRLSGGQILGLVGENGAGKSTLMNILGGVLQPDAGSMRLDGASYAPADPVAATRAGVVFVHQELNLFSNLSIADNLFITDFPKGRLPLFIHRARSRERAKEVLDRVGLTRDPNTTVDLLSPGERQQLEIAKSLKGDPKVVIFDEPTTSLTTRETERLFQLIRGLAVQGTSVIYISHILDDVLDLTDEVLILRDGKQVDRGKTSGFTAQNLISRMVGRDLKRLYPDKEAVAGSEVVLSVKGVSEPGIVHDISFEVCAGEVVGMFGLMGAGRTELARIIFGLDSFSHGTVEVNGVPKRLSSPVSAIESGIGFVTEDRRNEGLLMDVSVVKNIGLAVVPRFLKMGMVQEKQLTEISVAHGSALGLKSANPRRQPVRALSGGNQQKAVIAKWLLTKPQMLLLDEPTRGVDVGAKHEIYRVIDQLAADGTGVLMISSELPELLGTCDRILVMRQGELVADVEREDFDEHRILEAAFGQSTLAATEA